jgi:hypothetical protein
MAAPFRIPRFRVLSPKARRAGRGIPRYGRVKLGAQSLKEGLEMSIFTLISEDELDDSREAALGVEKLHCIMETS